MWKKVPATKIENGIGVLAPLISSRLDSAPVSLYRHPRRRHVFSGKTTVAKLFAGILADLGLLSKGEVVLKTASDFVGSALGESESKTRAILKASEGCVLVIDEAYSLSATGGVGSGGGADPYRAAVVDTLVEQVQNVPGEDRCVLLLGYRAEMEAFMRGTNPGLARRFALDNAFSFEDYTGAWACGVAGVRGFLRVPQYV